MNNFLYYVTSGVWIIEFIKDIVIIIYKVLYLFPQRQNEDIQAILHHLLINLKQI